MEHPIARRSAALSTRERALGLRRTTVPTALGRVVVRAGRRSGTTATILLHGAAGSWTTWTPLISASDATPAALRDLVVPDLPGWGESGPLPTGASVAAMSHAVVAVARALGYDSWRLVGHSLGGFVALDIAARHPQATVGVVLVSPSGAGVLDAIRRPVRGGLRLPGFAGMLIAMRTLAVADRAGRALARLLGRTGMLRVLAAPLFARPDSVHRTVTDALAHEIRPASFVRAARSARRYDEESWCRIACPVVAVRGEADVFAGDADGAGFAARIGDYRETLLAGAGHFAHIELPRAVLAGLDAIGPTRHLPRDDIGTPRPGVDPAVSAPVCRLAAQGTPGAGATGAGTPGSAAPVGRDARRSSHASAARVMSAG